MTVPKAALLALIFGAFTCPIMPLSQASTGDTDSLVKYYHVNIINEMPVDGKKVTMHCWSSEDDLGVKTLAQRDTYFFQFKINFSKTTLFQCEAVWGYVHRTFTGFSASRDEGRCEFHCWWAVREQGIFFSHDTVTWTLEYRW